MLCDQACGVLEDEAEDSYEGQSLWEVPKGENCHLLGRVVSAESKAEVEMGEARHQRRFPTEVER